MVTKNYIVGFCLLIVFAIQAVIAQETKPASPIIGSVSEPFRIASGSSFVASGNASGVGVHKHSRLTKAAITSDFNEALNLIRTNYVDKSRSASNELTKTSIESMLRTLDPHSSYFDAREYAELSEEHKSEFSGTGSLISSFLLNGRFETFIMATQAGSPAAQANLRFGDRILSINETNVSGTDATYVRELIRGPQGSVIRMKIERSATGKVESLIIKRELLHATAVPTGFMVGDNTGYIDLTRGFNYSTADEMKDAISELNRRGMKSLIIDLRGNPGGILSQSIKIAEYFLPEGRHIVSQKGRFSSEDRSWSSANKHPEILPVIVLVNGFTASASEVLAGALQDNDRALIVGQRTFGKGLVQNVISLPNGSGLALTASRYYTPTGRSIQRDYSDGSMYDYFNHRTAVSDIGTPQYVGRTITNRPVFGGDGITPDFIVSPNSLTAKQISLIDPLFFFTCDLVNGRINAQQNIESIRQQILFDEKLATVEMISDFKSYLHAQKKWIVSDATVTKNIEFVKTRLKYNLSMAAFGSAAANESLIKSDSQIFQAIKQMPESASLSTLANKTQ